MGVMLRLVNHRDSLPFWIYMKGNNLNKNLDRRSFIGKSSAIVAAAAFTGNIVAQDDAGFVLPKLPYAYDALEPFIDAKTVEIHYDKHHRTYISNLNKLLAGNKDLMKMDINQLVSNISKVPEAIRQGVTNNAGGNANHILINPSKALTSLKKKSIRQV
jgi:hypothetical protein